jgi:hypothetical protein
MPTQGFKNLHARHCFSALLRPLMPTGCGYELFCIEWKGVIGQFSPCKLAHISCLFFFLVAAQMVFPGSTSSAFGFLGTSILSFFFFPRTTDIPAILA